MINCKIFSLSFESDIGESLLELSRQYLTKRLFLAIRIFQTLYEF